MNQNKLNLNGWVNHVLLLCLSAPLLTHAWLGQFSRYYGDDFCFQVQLEKKGIFGAALYYYIEITGRYSDLFWEHFSGLFNTHIFYSPGAFLLVWFFVLASIIYLHRGKQYKDLTFSLLLSAAILFAVIDLIPNMYYRRVIDDVSHTWDAYPGIFQSLYWIAGRNRLIIPLIGATLIVGFIYRFVVHRTNGNTSPYLLFLIASMSFFCGGFGETYVALQTMVFILSALLFFLFYTGKSRNTFLIPLGIGILFSLFSMVVIILAPGNETRAEYFSQPESLPELLSFAWQGMNSTLFSIFKWPGNILSLIQVFGISLYIGFQSKVQVERVLKLFRKNLLILLPLAILILLYTAFLPAAYGISKPPPAREMIVIHYFLISLLSIWGIFIGGSLQPKLIKMDTRIRILTMLLFFVLFAVNGIRDSLQVLKHKEKLRYFASAYDYREMKIIQGKINGETKVTVPEINHFIGGSILKNDSTHWINECVSNYYGITVVTPHPE